LVQIAALLGMPRKNGSVPEFSTRFSTDSVKNLDAFGR
jgi:hypothetical protein